MLHETRRPNARFNVYVDYTSLEVTKVTQGADCCIDGQVKDGEYQHPLCNATNGFISVYFRLTVVLHAIIHQATIH